MLREEAVTYPLDSRTLMLFAEERIERLREDAVRTARPPRRRSLPRALPVPETRLACEAPRPSHSTS